MIFTLSGVLTVGSIRRTALMASTVVLRIGYKATNLAFAGRQPKEKCHGMNLSLGLAELVCLIERVKPNGEKRILVVEDQITVADALNLVLKMEGYKVETARNWREALNLFYHGKFALIFTDYKMPELNGHELASIIKSQDPSQPIILVTAYPNLANEKPSPDIDMVLEKPWSIDALRAALQKFLPDEEI